MRILQVNKFLYRRGGAEGVMLDVADMQRAAGHQVELFGMDYPENEPARYRAHFPSRVDFEPAPSSLGGRVELVGRMLWSTSAKRGIAAVLEDFRPDIVHMHNIYHQLSPSIVRACVAAGVPVVMTCHDYKLVCPTYQFLDHGEICTACVTDGLTQAVKRRCKDGSLAASAIAAVEVGAHRLLRAYGGVDRFLCPSVFLRDQFETAGIAAERLIHLDNFTEVDVPTRQGAGEAVLFAGRLASEKGIDVLIEAIGLLAADRPGVLLNVIGDGPDRAKLATRAEEIAPGAVAFHGRVSADGVREWLRRSRVSAVPSRWLENQPLSVLEAFASATPVVASALGGLNDLITPEVDGLLVPHEDPAALAAALARYLDDPHLSIRHGHAARERAVTRHAPTGHAERLFAIYDDAIARAGARVAS